VTTLSVIGTTPQARRGPTRSPAHPATCTTWPLPALAQGKILRAAIRTPHRPDRHDAGGGAARGAGGAHRRRGSSSIRSASPDQVALKTDRVRCVRDEVARVAAESAALAEAALDLIDVEYAELPAVFDPRAAVQPRAAGARGARAQPHRPAVPVQPRRRRGAFARRPRPSVEGEYRLNFVTPACLGTMVRSPTGPRGPAHDVVDDPGAVPLPRDLAQPGYRRDVSACCSAGGRQFDGAWTSADRRHRRAAGPAGPAPGEIEFERLESSSPVPRGSPAPSPAHGRRRRGGCWPATATS